MQKCGQRKSREIKEVKLPMRNEMKTTGLKMRSSLDSIRTETGEVLKSMLSNLSALSFYPASAESNDKTSGTVTSFPSSFPSLYRHPAALPVPSHPSSLVLFSC